VIVGIMVLRPRGLVGTRAPSLILPSSDGDRRAKEGTG